MGKRVSPGVEKLDRQKYRLWWTDPKTHKECSSIFYGTGAAAIAARADIVASIDKKTYVTPSRKTLGQYVRAYLRAMKLKDDVAPTTHARYSSLLLGTLDDHLGQIPLQDLEGTDIDAYYLWALENERTRKKDADGNLKPISPATVAKRHQALKMVLKDAVRKREIRYNPADEASAPKQKRPEGIAFTAKEASIVLKACYASDKMDATDTLATRVAFYTGLRIGEVLGLRFHDLDGGKLSVAGKILEMSGRLEWSSYPKSAHSRRTITVDPLTASLLKAHIAEQKKRRLAIGKAWGHKELVFTTPFGGIVRPNTLSGHFTDIVRPLEESHSISTRGATFHSTRHTHATTLLRAGVPISVVSKRLGHSSELITLLYYSHVLPGDDAAAAEVIAASGI